MSKTLEAYGSWGAGQTHRVNVREKSRLPSCRLDHRETWSSVKGKRGRKNDYSCCQVLFEGLASVGLMGQWRLGTEGPRGAEGFGSVQHPWGREQRGERGQWNAEGSVGWAGVCTWRTHTVLLSFALMGSLRKGRNSAVG